MTATAEAKAERLQIRLDARAKTLLEQAASYRHETVSQFVLRTSVAEAEQVVKAHEVVTLKDADWQVFYEALVNPPKPNAALRKAFARYLKDVG